MIFLDFDGVLFDTVKEAYAVTLISLNKKKSLDEINFDNDHYKKFRNLRYTISAAWNYLYLYKYLDSDSDIELVDIKDSEKELLKNISVAKKKDYEKFEEKFFHTRDLLIKQSYKKWLKLNTPYPFLEKIKDLINKFPDLIYIISTKDKSTILELLLLEKINFDERKIFDNLDFRKFGSKKLIIEKLIKLSNQGIYIDDSTIHLSDCSVINGLVCLQPNWGYASPYSNNTSTMNRILKEMNNYLEKTV